MACAGFATRVGTGRWRGLLRAGSLPSAADGMLEFEERIAACPEAAGRSRGGGKALPAASRQGRAQGQNPSKATGLQSAKHPTLLSADTARATNGAAPESLPPLPAGVSYPRSGQSRRLPGQDAAQALALDVPHSAAKTEHPGPYGKRQWPTRIARPERRNVPSHFMARQPLRIEVTWAE
jgi:hypothetical protein